MKTVQFDRRLIKDDFSNVVYGNDNKAVTRIEFFPSAHVDRQLFAVLSNGDVVLAREDGYNPNGPGFLYIRLDDEKLYLSKIKVLINDETAMRKVIVDDGSPIEDGWSVCKTYDVNMFYN